MQRGVYKMSKFRDKFYLSPEQTLFLAKKNGMKMYVVE